MLDGVVKIQFLLECYRLGVAQNQYSERTFYTSSIFWALQIILIPMWQKFSLVNPYVDFFVLK